MREYQVVLICDDGDRRLTILADEAVTSDDNMLVFVVRNEEDVRIVARFRRWDYMLEAEEKEEEASSSDSMTGSWPAWK